jgi:hypothetical protein
MDHYDYVGLDVSLKQTSICVVSGTGSVVREGNVRLHGFFDLLFDSVQVDARALLHRRQFDCRLGKLRRRRWASPCVQRDQGYWSRPRPGE